MTARLGMVHTVPALAERFERLAARLGGPVEVLHVVDPALLAQVVRDGEVTATVRDRAVAHARYLAGQGVGAVLVTCSSIGECADLADDGSKVPVLRVDRPMAAQAVARAAAPGARGRVAVLATVAATLGPTRRLLQAEAARAGAVVDVAANVVPDAAEARARGDQAGHDARVRAAVERAVADADVLVLAQASMADALASGGAGGLVTGGSGDGYGGRVLSSPVSGLRAVLAAVGVPAR
ncbi:aspartate/glutamate racemase family protein [Georgenia sp. TF02-10]|uniref:aspartate/glutamate racemase family protein n=1 Tax=Georgenia sp. TF02-10 TaxID=2917725 RepID=UPI001FA7D6ED|nr:aspartate/glutamate racemase family protein [Georgenia sp. TF02-10]UNX56267.1 aspartate/glutamate racemase family protein [Georgenia sp. TF02-10]